MFRTWTTATVALLAAAMGGVAEAGHHRFYPCVPISCYPIDPCGVCWPYHPPYPPETSPLVPPPHPVPHTLLQHALTLRNTSYSHHFAAIYIRHPDCVYREYERVHRRAGDSASAAQPYFAGDNLYIETWAWDGHCWRFQCRSFIVLGGGSSTFDVSRCIHSP